MVSVLGTWNCLGNSFEVDTPFLSVWACLCGRGLIILRAGCLSHLNSDTVNVGAREQLHKQVRLKLQNIGYSLLYNPYTVIKIIVYISALFLRQSAIRSLMPTITEASEKSEESQNLAFS